MYVNVCPWFLAPHELTGQLLLEGLVMVTVSRHPEVGGRTNKNRIDGMLGLRLRVYGLLRSIVDQGPVECIAWWR